jgi:hypothetical protein
MLRSGIFVAGCLLSFAARSTPLPTTSIENGRLCRSAIQQAETGAALPLHLLGAIALVESGRADRVTGRIEPWPWTINAEGQGRFFETKAEAIAFTRQLLARGIKSIDVGCLQINLMYHPDAFRDLDEAFDPPANARYAVRFLAQLRDKTGSWDLASSWYHSTDPRESVPYRAKVVSAMAREADDPDPTISASLMWPVSAMTMRGGLTGHGTMMLPRPTGGVILGRANATGGGMGTPSAARSLDSYRLQPVMTIKRALTAAR